MTVLTKGGMAAMAIETVAGTYLAPTVTLPWTACKYDSMYTPLRDESVRNSDAVLQGLYQGTGDGSIDITLHAYPDLLGYFLRMVGTDTVTAATTGTLSANANIGDTSISSAVSYAQGQVVRIGTAPAVEYVYVTGAPTGSGPYTMPITTVRGSATAVGLQKSHTSGDALSSRTKHTFKQNAPATRPPTYSFSFYDLVSYVGMPGGRISELALKIDPKATVTVQAKLTSFPEQSVPSFTYAGTNTQPLLGWGWNMTNAGGSSDRGLTLDLTMKRAVEAIHGSNGQQAPREVFAAGLELDGSYKAIYESLTDYNLYLANTQTATVVDVWKAVAFGGEELKITMSQSGWPKGSRETGGAHMEASFDISAINNTTDSGIAQIDLFNWQTTAY